MDYANEFTHKMGLVHSTTFVYWFILITHRFFKIDAWNSNMHKNKQFCCAYVLFMVIQSQHINNNCILKSILSLFRYIYYCIFLEGG